MAKSNTGMITISRLKVACIIGCNPEEREKEQELFIDMRLTVPLPSADVLAKTVDYGSVALLAAHCAKEGRFYLIERLAMAVAQGVLQQFPLVQDVWVKIVKPKAVPGAEHAAFEVALNSKGKTL